MNTNIRHDLQGLLNSLLDGKLPRNLPWNEVVELIGQIGKVQPHGGDEFVFLVGSQREFFKRPHSHDLDVEEVSRLRRFLHKAAVGTVAAKPHVAGRVVVIIDHHAAHLYRNADEPGRESETTVKPYDPFNFHHHLIHRKEAHYQGERVPEEHSFYEEIAQDLVNATEIIVVGHETGTSDAADFLAAYLKKHHPAIAQRVITSETVDLSALSQLELEQIAAQHLIRKS